MRHLKIMGLALLLSVAWGCGNDSSTQDMSHDAVSDASDGADSIGHPDSSTQAEEIRPGVTHKMMKNTGENLFASLAYECAQCTFEQWESIVPPQGWSKGPAQVAVFSAPDSVLRSYPPVVDHPAAVDFLSEVPGDEYKVIAITHSGRIVANGANGIVAEVQVERDTRLVFTAGMRVHELTAPEGDVFVLFAHHVDTAAWENTDFQSEDALDYLTAPEGWTYSTRTLDEELALDSESSQGVVTVLAIRGAVNSTWEKR